MKKLKFKQIGTGLWSADTGKGTAIIREKCYAFELRDGDNDDPQAGKTSRERYTVADALYDIGYDINDLALITDGIHKYAHLDGVILVITDYFDVSVEDKHAIYYSQVASPSYEMAITECQRLLRDM